MKKLVIIGANDFQNQLILKAKSLGYETHVFAWEDGAVGKDTADFFYPVSIIEKEKILNICKGINPDGVCSIASDLASVTVNYVAENLGLPCNKTKYSAIQTNKYQMRRALSAAGIPCPKFVCVEEKFDKSLLKDFSFPVIVKPTDRSGSREIMKLETLDNIDRAVQAACKVSFEHKAIIEEYLDGNEYSMETISQNGVHHYLATTKKYTTGAPHFIETGHRQPSGLPDEINQKAIDTVMNALDALHVENSAGHSEFKVDADGNIKIIEIGARMGGDCIGSDLVYLSTGNDFVKMVIDIAAGKKLDSIKTTGHRTANIKFIFTKEDLDEMNRFRNTNPERIYRISEMKIENLGDTCDSGSRVGYYLFT
ncbi:MAG: ATP-grasp domain-containing protein [Clostridia bacterium]|nr:ATP-grasp domain-containing protein [Clostridia bacterium]